MRYLIPVDFTSVSINALLYALKKGHKEDSYTLLHAWNSLLTLTEPFALVAGLTKEEALLKQLDHFLEEFVSEHPEFATYKIDVKATFGTPVQSILQEIKNESYDAVIMGARDKYDLLDKILGSTAYGVIESSDIPVYVIPADSLFKEPKKALAVIDVDCVKNGNADKIVAWSSASKADVNFIHLSSGKSVCKCTKHLLAKMFDQNESMKNRFTFSCIPANNAIEEILSKTKSENFDVIILGIENNNSVFQLFKNSFFQEDRTALSDTHSIPLKYLLMIPSTIKSSSSIKLHPMSNKKNDKIITLFGTRSSTYEYFKFALKQMLKEANVHLDIQEVNDIDVFVTEKIESIPSIRIGNGTSLSYKEPEPIQQFLYKAFQLILNECNCAEKKNMVVPIDFSHASLNAYKYARKIASSVNTHITLLHYIAPTRHNQEVKKQKLNQLVELSESNIHFRGDFSIDPVTTHQVRRGLAGDQIPEDTSDADLIVMGTTGTSAGVKKLFGSVARNVVNNAQAPVLLIPPKYEGDPAKKILCPFELAIEDFEDIRWLIHAFNAQIHLIHADNKRDKSDSLRDLISASSDLPQNSTSWHVVSFSKGQKARVEIEQYIKDEEIDLLILKNNKSHNAGDSLDEILRQFMGRLDVPVLLVNDN